MTITPAGTFYMPRFGFASTRTIMEEWPILPAERKLVEGASDKRRREFTTGRYCARLALRNLGLLPGAILQDKNGAPIWPLGTIGSISHTFGLCIALVSIDTAAKGVGVDVEYLSNPFSAEVFEAITTAEEKKRFLKYPQSLEDKFRYAIFSAKESVIKCLYANLRINFVFEEIDIYVDPEITSFTPRIIGIETSCQIRGHIGFSSNHVVTLAWWLS